MNGWLDGMREARSGGRKRLAVLLDPDKFPAGKAGADHVARIADSAATDVFIGGSLLERGRVEDVLGAVRAGWSGPVVLFPGSPDQTVPGADAILLLSLISGRNPDLLIGRHVEAALRIRRQALPTVPTGYLLIGDGPLSAAAYVSGTLPLPEGKPGLAVATAVAGELLGLQALYLDAGSGAGRPVPAATVAAVRAATSVPLIVGGGLREAADIERAWAAGADCAVVGTAVEADPTVLERLPHCAGYVRSGIPG